MLVFHVITFTANKMCVSGVVYGSSDFTRSTIRDYGRDGTHQG
jgi:hypothetical protein